MQLLWAELHLCRYVCAAYRHVEADRGWCRFQAADLKALRGERAGRKRKEPESMGGTAAAVQDTKVTIRISLALGPVPGWGSAS